MDTGILIIGALIVVPAALLLVLIPRYRRAGRPIRTVFRQPGAFAGWLGSFAAALVAVSFTTDEPTARYIAIGLSVLVIALLALASKRKTLR